MAGIIGDNEENILEEAVQQFVDTQSRGQKIDIDEFVSKYPAYELRLRQRILNLQKIDSLFDSLVKADEQELPETVSFAASVLSPGSQMERFRIERELGRGGMGVVYLAHDMKLDRPVAIKSMPPELLGKLTAQARFRREAKLLASLNHPNIAVIHEIIEKEECAAYLVLEYVPGDTLAQRIARKPLKLEEALSIGQQIVEAVAAAHDKGVIHRDLKPGNIKITPDGRVKVLDFGLAKPAGSEAASKDSTITRPGSMIGTPAYMSPEQIRGKPTDHRTDIWSFGCIMYEMLTGERPFEGDTVSDTVAHILEREPDWRVLPPGIPVNVRALLRRCMEKDRQRRLQHIRDAAIEIREALSLPLIGSPPAGTSLEMSRERKTELWRHIAVLPFANMSADPENEYFGDGLAEELINALTRIEGLRVVARTSAFQFKGQAIDVREIGNRLNVEIVLEGSVRKIGNRLRISAQLIDVADGYHIWSERYAREMEDVFTIQDDIAGKIVSALKVKLVGEQKRQLIKRYTENIEAYNLYLRGRFHWNKRTGDGFSKAIESLEQALAIDPDYAMAYAGLADCYAMMGTYGLLRGREALQKAKTAALKALEIDKTLPGPHGSLGLVSAIYEYDWPEAERHFQQAFVLDPDYTIAHAWYVWFLLVPTGRFQEAEEEARRVVQLDPVTPSTSVTLGFVYHMQRRDDQAIEEYKRVLELDPNYPSVNIWLGDAYAAKGMYAEAIAKYERAGTMLTAAAGRALAYGLSGKRDVSQKLLDDLENAIQKGSPGTAAWVARTFAQLGEADTAFEYLEKGYRDRDTQVVWLKVDPFFDSLRCDPRFDELLRRMNLI